MVRRIGLPVDFDGPPEALENDLDEAIFVARDPRIVAERRIDASETLAVGWVAGGAVSVAMENFATQIKASEFGRAEILHRRGDHFLGFNESRLSGEKGLGGRGG
ncbi:MAG: hypothetical protein J6386_16270 [Candidatus Synoicihabitans palmerolidicus]|nr:hypothetical protein [Candidatus Synoicihabitans palmerolidicus]